MKFPKYLQTITNISIQKSLSQYLFNFACHVVNQHQSSHGIKVKATSSAKIVMTSSVAIFELSAMDPF